MRQNVRSTGEFIKLNRARSTHQSPPIEEQTNPLGKTDLCATKLRKVEDRRRWGEGRERLVGGGWRRVEGGTGGR
jgi:hypothetical protein